jgi:hypothetical protein
MVIAANKRPLLPLLFCFVEGSMRSSCSGLAPAIDPNCDRGKSRWSHLNPAMVVSIAIEMPVIRDFYE